MSMTPAQNTQAYIQGFEDGERATKVKMLREREWVELTDEDRNECLVEADPCECLATPEAQELMRCVAAKLRSKNT
jgi:hypothetical protein